MVKFEQNTVYHAETEEEAKWILNEGAKQNYKWCTGESFLKNQENNISKDYPYYNICNGTRGCLSHYKNNDVNIIKVKNLMTDKIIDLW